MLASRLGGPPSSIRAKSWSDPASPRRILAIRLQAMGDVVITLPYLKSLKRRHPDSVIDFLTRQETEEVPGHVAFFDRVFSIGGGRIYKRQFLHTIAILPR